MIDNKTKNMVFSQYYWAICKKCGSKYANVAGSKPHKCNGVKINQNKFFYPKTF